MTYKTPDDVIGQAIKSLDDVDWGTSPDGPDEREVVECVAPIIARAALKAARHALAMAGDPMAVLKINEMIGDDDA